jgi:ubiquitin carboxyl-terminal hydrolase 7
MDAATLPNTLADMSLQDDIQPTGPAQNPAGLDAPEEHVVEPNGTESEDVAIINPPDQMDTDTLLASDCTLLPFPSLRTIRLPCSDPPAS